MPVSNKCPFQLKTLSAEQSYTNFNNLYELYSLASTSLNIDWPYHYDPHNLAFKNIYLN